LNGYPNNLFNYQHSPQQVVEGNDTERPSVEAKKMFGPLLAVTSQSHRAGELYALRVL